MKNKKQIKMKVGALLMAIGILLPQLILPVAAVEIETPQIPIAGPPEPELIMEVENISQNTGNYAVGDVLKYTVTFTNNGPESVWYDIEGTIILGPGLDLINSYPITVNGVENIATYDTVNKTILVGIGDIEGELIDLIDDVYYHVGDQEYVVIEFYVVVNETGNLNNVTVTANGLGIDAEFSDRTIEKTLTTYINGNETLVSEAPMIDNIYDGDKKISGIGVPEAKITVTLPDGSEVTTIVEDDGTWSIDVPDTITLAEGDLVTAVQKEENKEVSQPASETVKDLQRVLEQSELPTIDTIYDGDKEVNGTGVPGAEIIVTLPDGSEVTIIVEDDGTWSVDVPDGVILKAGDKVTVVQREEGKADSQPIVGVVQPVEDLDVSTEKPSTIPPTQKPSVDTSISSSTSISDVNTGDNTNVSLLLGMLVTSLAGILFVNRKRKETK